VGFFILQSRPGSGCRPLYTFYTFHTGWVEGPNPKPGGVGDLMAP